MELARKTESRGLGPVYDMVKGPGVDSGCLPALTTRYRGTVRQGTVSFPVDKKDMVAMAKTFLREFPAADHPYMVEHINYHIDTGVLGEGDFEFGLDLLLDSLERLRDSHPN